MRLRHPLGRALAVENGLWRLHTGRGHVGEQPGSARWSVKCLHKAPAKSALNRDIAPRGYVHVGGCQAGGGCYGLKVIRKDRMWLSITLGLVEVKGRQLRAKRGERIRL